MSTINYADVYGQRSAAGTVYSPGVQVTGPNQSAVTGSGQAGATTQAAGTGSAFSWLGFVALLVVLRVALESGGSSR